MVIVVIFNHIPTPPIGNINSVYREKSITCFFFFVKGTSHTEQQSGELHGKSKHSFLLITKFFCHTNTAGMFVQSTSSMTFSLMKVSDSSLNSKAFFMIANITKKKADFSFPTKEKKIQLQLVKHFHVSHFILPNWPHLLIIAQLLHIYYTLPCICPYPSFTLTFLYYYFKKGGKST